jgi:hypothetical protein
MERVHRWFGWHPVITGVLSGIPGLFFAGLFAAMLADHRSSAGERIGGLVFAACIFVLPIVLPIRWARRGVRIINDTASAQVERAVEQIVTHACGLGRGFERGTARLCWVRSGRAPFIRHAIDHAIAPVFVTERGLGICDYTRFSLRSPRIRPSGKLTEVAYDTLASAKPRAPSSVVLTLRSGQTIELVTHDGRDELLAVIRPRIPAPEAPVPVSRPAARVAAQPPVSVSVSVAVASAPQVVVQREVIERQVIVMRCAHCGELTPVDLTRCKNCGASVGA